jgi:hypothetical protein
MRIYTASLQQDGNISSNPTTTVHDTNLCGTLVWTYNAVGEYNGTLIGAFPSGKVWCVGDIKPYEYGDEISCSLQRNDDDSIILNIFDSTGTRVDGCKVDLEIKIY